MTGTHMGLMHWSDSRQCTFGKDMQKYSLWHYDKQKNSGRQVCRGPTASDTSDHPLPR